MGKGALRYHNNINEIHYDDRSYSISASTAKDLIQRPNGVTSASNPRDRKKGAGMRIGGGGGGGIDSVEKIMPIQWIPAQTSKRPGGIDTKPERRANDTAPGGLQRDSLNSISPLTCLMRGKVFVTQSIIDPP